MEKRDCTAQDWHEFKPRATTLSLSQMLGRLFWNARWNESLFLMSCAERLLDYPTSHSEEEIFKRLIHEIRTSDAKQENNYIQFRLMFIRREANGLVEEIRYQSDIRQINDEA